MPVQFSFSLLLVHFKEPSSTGSWKADEVRKIINKDLDNPIAQKLM
jgi:hypothetical protein